MKVRWSEWLGLLVLVLFTTTAYATETDVPRFTTKVAVIVSGDTELQNVVMSHLHREVASLAGVELVDNRPDRVISVVAREIRKVGRYRTGIVLSTAFMAPYYSDPTPSILKEKDRVGGPLLTSGLIFGLSQNLYIDSADNIQGMCRKIIADFDAEQVEPRRKRFQRIK